MTRKQRTFDEAELNRNPLSFLSKPWVQKTLFWVLLLTVLVYLRSFFPLIFLTFLFSVLMEAVVRRTENLVPARRIRVVGVFLLLLAFWGGLFTFMVPRISTEFQRAMQRLPELRGNIHHQVQLWKAERDRVPGAADLLLGLLDAALNQVSKEKVDEFVKRNTTEILGFVPGAIGHLLWAVTVFLLSLIFSFLIVWDFPGLVRGYRELEKTRAGPFFQVARETFSPFGQVLARALGAQTVIALVNTGLTAVGMALLRIPMIEVLSVIVFLCSFIPVAGVFISSAPICIVALGNHGLGAMFAFIGVVTLVHMIEAYILNPRIYGAHLKLNPLVVLILLVVAHHLLGVWGLLLATPVGAYIFHHVLKRPEARAPRPPEREREEVEVGAH